MAPNLQEQMLIQDQVQGSLVFNVTSYMNLIQQKQDPDKDYRWFNYGDLGLDLYSNGIMVSQKLLKENPKAVAGLVRAINRALKEVIDNPDMGVATLAKIEPLINSDVEKKRIAYALGNLMNGAGVHRARLRRSEGRQADALDRPDRGSLRPEEPSRRRRRCSTAPSCRRRPIACSRRSRTDASCHSGRAACPNPLCRSGIRSPADGRRNADHVD